jgi:hypothetical protein
LTAPPAAADTAAASVAVAAHQADLETVLAVASAEMTAVWTQLVGAPAQTVRDELMAALPVLLSTYGSAAATLGADWYDEMRQLATSPGRFTAIPIDLPDADHVNAVVGWATQPLFEPQPAPGTTPETLTGPAAVKARLDGGWQKLVADMDRDTVRGSLIRDPAAKGWARKTTGKSCPFCVMLAARGAVYSATTAAFASHDHCDCVAVPVFGGDPRPVKEYVPSPKLRSAAQRAANNQRLREYLANGRTSRSSTRAGI